MDGCRSPVDGENVPCREGSGAKAEETVSRVKVEERFGSNAESDGGGGREVVGEVDRRRGGGGVGIKVSLEREVGRRATSAGVCPADEVTVEVGVNGITACECGDC